MSFTNSTPNYGLPQYIGTDKPTYLGDMNTAYSTIDTQMKANADAASAATSTANTAAATATAASTNATTALNTANSAASEAASATSAAASATSTANNAATDASAALRASAANTIENLAPAYDPTLTYSVGNLVTYIDENNSGKLYKCIVAVAAPEAFNINKWDDVTTSEVYSRGYVEIASHTYTGSETQKEALDTMGTAIASLLPSIKNAIIELENIDGSAFDYYTLHYRNETTLTFNKVSVGNSQFLVEAIDVSTNSNSSRRKWSVNSTPAATLTNDSSEIPSAGYKVRIYAQF